MDTQFNIHAHHHPIINSDKLLFQTNSHRKLLIRRYKQGEFGYDRFMTFFEKDEGGQVREVDTTIIRQLFPGCRKKIILSLVGYNIENTDAAISAFLIGRGFDPATLKRAEK